MSEGPHIASTITQHRERLGMTKASLARALSVSDVVVSYWERGDIKQIGHQRLAKLAALFDISLDELMGTNGRQDASIAEEERQLLTNVIAKVQDRYLNGDPLYLEASELALLANNTSLAGVLQVKKHA